jgi:hypothetical protein
MASIISAGTTSGTSLNLSGDTSGVLQLASNGSTTAVTINTSQQVGIGTTSPTANTQVDIVSADSSQQYVDVLRLKTSNSGDVHPAVLFENNRGSISNAFKIAMDSSASAGTSTLVIRMKNSGGTFNTAFVLQNDGRLQFNSGYGSAAVAYGCRAWVNFNGTGTPAIRASGNVSSITDNGTGVYTVNFTTAMPDINYASALASEVQTTLNISSKTTSDMQVTCRTVGGSNIDVSYIDVSIFR